MGLEEKWGIQIGTLPKGRRNLITDIGGITIGHFTLSHGQVQTGVTALFPHDGNIFLNKLPAAIHVINGYGKSTGLIQVEEMGFIETPLLLTNTFAVGTAYTAAVRYMLKQNADIGLTTGTINPVIFECNDGYLNDIRGLHIQEEHVENALKACSKDFLEGDVGAGKGMCCHELKGGIGSASRVLSIGEKEYTLGCLVLTNHALLKDLTVNGYKLGQEMTGARMASEPDKGSVIIILATDIPLCERQLKRACKRAVAGLSRTGSHIGNGSGEITLAFSTANMISHYPGNDITTFNRLHEDNMDMVFRAVIETVEESVLSSMLHAASVTGRDGHRGESLAEYIHFFKERLQ